MATSLLTKISVRLMAVLISIFYAFNPYVAPTTDDLIETSKDTGASLTFAAWADPQVSNYIPKRTQYFDAACEDISNAKDNIDALILAGDISENGLQCEYKYIYDGIVNAKVNNYLLAVGNHDVRMKLSYKQTVKNFTNLCNLLNSNADSELAINTLNYSYTINGYTFIVLATDRTEFEESYLSAEQLQWLDSTLSNASMSGLPTFVIVHQPLKLTHGLPDTWNSPFDGAGSIGKQSNDLYNILNKYENTFLITGHLHTGIGKYTYEKLDNINSVNLPSLTIDNKDGENNENGIGFMFEVYTDHVLLRARNFAKGIYEPEYDINIPLK